MTHRNYEVEFRLLDVLKALMEVSCSSQGEYEWIRSEIKKLEEAMEAEV